LKTLSIPSDCWLEPTLAIRSSTIEGRGLFATVALAAGTVVARLGGRLVTRKRLLEMFAEQERTGGAYIDCLSVDDGIDLVLPAGLPMHFVNHGCDPNVWHVDALTLATRRAIAKDEELTLDYATQADGDFEMGCGCGSRLCRRRITGTDWRLPELQTRCAGHWVPILAARIAGSDPMAKEGSDPIVSTNRTSSMLGSDPS
jgi:hypothetical protein